MPEAKLRLINFAGPIIAALIFLSSIIYGAGAFASKTTIENDADKLIASSLKGRIETVDKASASMASRMAVVETSIGFILSNQARQESALNRIENAVTRKPGEK